MKTRALAAAVVSAAVLLTGCGTAAATTTIAQQPPPAAASSAGPQCDPASTTTGGAVGVSTSAAPDPADVDSGIASALDGTGETRLTAEQEGNARTIINVGRTRGISARAWAVALAAAMQESRLRNLNHGDRDSLGLFQQRPSHGWGTPEQITDPDYAAGKFYTALAAVPDWRQLPIGAAAQAVQQSGYPTAYDQWQPLATYLVSAFAGSAVDCPSGSGGGALPARAAGTAIAYALAQIGKPYVWGAAGPDSFDCSGLMLRAWQAAGMTLPRVSRQQYQAGTHVPVAAAVPGDLVFWSYNIADPGQIHHVAMYLGGGEVVEAYSAGYPLRRHQLYNQAQLMPYAVHPTTT